MVAAVVGATVVGGYLASENYSDASSEAASVQSNAAMQSATLQSDASVRAAEIQAGASRDAATMQQTTAREGMALQQAAADKAIAQRREAFDITRGLLQPWVDQGNQARDAQGNLIGLNGAGPQQTAIDALKSGPAFTSMQRTGQNAILSNASATGGLRGGNVNGALAQYDETLLSALIDQQYGRLTGISNVGVNAAGNIGNAAIGFGSGAAADLTGAANASANGMNAAANAGAAGIVGAGNAAAGGLVNSANATANGINNAASAGAGGILAGARADNMLINSAVNAAGVYAGMTGGYRYGGYGVVPNSQYNPVAAGPVFA